jgi:hypothetical protein
MVVPQQKSVMEKAEGSQYWFYVNGVESDKICGGIEDARFLW